MSESRDFSEVVDRAASAVVKARHVVALVGAGMSVESGIPPFRGPGGLWTKYGEPTSLGYREFMDDPALWWASRLEEEKTPGNASYDMKAALDEAKPNPGHFALAEMERMGALQYVITQNVDGLHFRAGSVNVAEIHGNRTKLRCIECTLRVGRDDFPVVEFPPLCPECARYNENRHGDVRRTHTGRCAQSVPGPSGPVRLHVDDWHVGHGPSRSRNAPRRQGPGHRGGGNQPVPDLFISPCRHHAYRPFGRGPAFGGGQSQGQPWKELAVERSSAGAAGETRAESAGLLRVCRWSLDYRKRRTCT